MHEVSTWQLLKIYSLCTQQVEKNANILVRLNDFSYAVSAPLNFHKQVQRRHMGMPTIPTSKSQRTHNFKIYSNTITILSEHWYWLLMCFTIKMNRIPNNSPAEMKKHNRLYFSLKIICFMVEELDFRILFIFLSDAGAHFKFFTEVGRQKGSWQKKKKTKTFFPRYLEYFICVEFDN